MKNLAKTLKKIDKSTSFKNGFLAYVINGLSHKFKENENGQFIQGFNFAQVWYSRNK